jgi:cell division protein FtsL
MIPTFAREKAKMSRSDKIYYISCVVVFLLTIIMYAYPSIQLMQQVYEERELEKEKRKLLAEQNRLRLEYEMLMSPDEMEERAKLHGYAEPAAGQIIYIKKIR